MAYLENPEESPCFGCGPKHARGLHLQFERAEGEDGVPEVRTSFTPKPDEIGWPTVFHHGLHFLVMSEVSYWTALTLTGKVWVMVGPATYTADRLPRVGVGHLARGRIVEQTPEHLAIRVTTATVEAGKSCGSLESSWRPASRVVVDRAHIPLPEYLREDLFP